MKKVCCICWRPYELFNIIIYLRSIITDGDMQIDLFLSDIPSLENASKLVIKLGLFRNVWHFHEYRTRKSWRNALDQIFPKHAVVRDTYAKNFPMKYDMFLATGYLYYFLWFAECNPKADFYLLEDGLESYLNSQIKQIEQSWKSQLLKKLNRGALSLNWKTLYVHAPDLVVGNYDFPVNKMPVITKNIYDDLLCTFDFKHNTQYDRKKIIYLAEPFLNLEIKKKQEEIFKLLISVRQHVIIRTHPAEGEIKTDLEQDEKNEMWELESVFLNEDAILIADFSSAQLTPYFLYKKSCKLVFLYQYYGSIGKQNRKQISDFIERLKSIYKGEIYIPNNLGEFAQLLSEINL